MEEVDKLLAACETPVERAVIEVLYSTGVRVSELVSLRVEDITWSEPGVIRVQRGKGDKDRNVCFGKPAATAMREYLNGRATGFLFEAPARTGQFFKGWRSWYACFYDAGEQRQVRLGKIHDPRGFAREKLLEKIRSLRASGVGWKEIRRRVKISRERAEYFCRHPRLYRRRAHVFLSESEARSRAESLKADTAGFTAHPAGPYDARSIRLLLSRLAFRAGIGRVHPHALRRSFATHLLQGGADIRSVQELLGHTSLSSTMLYTRLSIDDLKAIHTRSHPHAKEDEHDEEK